MEQVLLTTEQASGLMGMGIARSLSLLRAHGVQPIDLGRGRGNGLRWHRRAVMTVIDTLHAEAQAKAGVPRRRRPPKRSGCVIGKSAKELLAEFNMGAVQ